MSEISRIIQWWRLHTLSFGKQTGDPWQSSAMFSPWSHRWNLDHDKNSRQLFWSTRPSCCPAPGRGSGPIRVVPGARGCNCRWHPWKRSSGSWRICSSLQLNTDQRMRRGLWRWRRHGMRSWSADIQTGLGYGRSLGWIGIRIRERIRTSLIR